MTMAISKAKEAGSEAVICASTGNTSAAAAAYARRGGMRAFVLIPDGYVAQGKLAQALLYGAEVLAVQGNFDRALAIVRDVADRYPVTLVNSLNPYRLQGQKTAAFEVVDALPCGHSALIYRQPTSCSRPTGQARQACCQRRSR